jgi:hypothetical protein
MTACPMPCVTCLNTVVFNSEEFYSTELEDHPLSSQEEEMQDKYLEIKLCFL